MACSHVVKESMCLIAGRCREPERQHPARGGLEGSLAEGHRRSRLAPLERKCS